MTAKDIKEIRYPEDLRMMHKKVDKKYTKDYFRKGKEIWKWLLEKLGQ